MSAPALEFRSVSKSFGALRAVADVSLRISEGSITGLVGENGAGKSTLMNIAYGLVAPEAGEILLFGREAAIASPLDALRLGIGMVHQHFMLVETFTVLENLVLGAEGGAGLRRSLAEGREALARLDRLYGLRVDPDALVGDLPVGDQQRVEIAKALHRGARILVLDEPTAVLTPRETDGLFAMLRDLSAGGVTVVLITHKLKEIMAVTDRVLVMRQGRLVGERETAETTPEDLAWLMIGDALPAAPARAARPVGPVRLAAEGLTLASPRGGPPLLDGVDLSLRAGEITGIAGVSGNGQTELLQVLAGMRRPTSGRIVLEGRAITPDRPADPAAMRRLGLAHLPEDRHRHAMVAEAPASDTAILGRQHDPALGRLGLSPEATLARCRTLMERLDVRPRAPGLRAGLFSGGNQQKLVMAREVAASPRILLVGQPTRGVDIGAIAAIHREIRALRDAGCAILLVSSELDEILALADRILVMGGGRITGEVEAVAADAGTLGLMMSHERGAPAAIPA